MMMVIKSLGTIVVILGVFYQLYKYSIEQPSVELSFRVAASGRMWYAAFIALVVAIACMVVLWFYRRAIRPHKSKGGKELRYSISSMLSPSSEPSANNATTPADRTVQRLSTVLRKHAIVDQFWGATTSGDGGGGGALNGSSSSSSSSSGGGADIDLLYTVSSKFVTVFTKAEFESFYTKVEWKVLSRRETLFHMNDDGDEAAHRCMYIVVKGSLGLCWHPNATIDTTTPRSTYVVGDSFGELSLLLGDDDESKCRYTCAALEDETQLICIPRSLYREASAQKPDLLVNFIRSTLTRYWHVSHAMMCDKLGYGGGYIEDVVDTVWPTDSEEFKQLVALGRRRVCAAGVDIPVERNHIYVLMDGRVSIRRRGAHNNTANARSTQLTAGAIVGVVSALSGANPYAKHHVTALSRVTVCCIQLDEHEKAPPACLQRVLMAGVRVVAPVLREFTAIGFQREWKQGGDHLFHEDTLSDYVYFIISGRVRALLRKPDGSVTKRFEVGPDSCVGEVSFLAASRSRHSHSVVCMRDTDVVKISRAAFDDCVTQYPLLLDVLSRSMAARFGQVLHHEIQQDMIENIALVAANPCVDLVEFATKLREHLSPFGSVAHVDTNEFSRACYTDIEDLTQFALRSTLKRWFTHMNATYRFVLLVTDAERPLWSRACVRSADAVLIVGDTANGNSPSVGAWENTLVWEDVRLRYVPKHLVLCHDANIELPSGTNAWLSGGRHRLRLHHHVRRGTNRHLASLARILANEATGLVLGGGGARGLAHLGVLRCMMEEHEIPVDYVCGTSQGSMMAALVSLHDCNFEKVQQGARLNGESMSNIWNLICDATVPTLSYFTGQGMNEGIQRLLGKHTYIEDLWVPFFAVATNITKPDIHVMRSGLLWKAVRSSSTVVEYLPPVYENMDGVGHLLIDGAYINNLPVDVMRQEFGPKRVFAVDVENKDEDITNNITPFGDSLSGVWLMLRRVYGMLNPFAPRFHIPRFSDLLTLLKFVNNNRNTETFISKKLMDCYMRPDLGDTKLLDYHKMDSLVAAGYQCASRELQRYLNDDPRSHTLRLRRRSSTMDDDH